MPGWITATLGLLALGAAAVSACDGDGGGGSDDVTPTAAGTAPAVATEDDLAAHEDELRDTVPQAITAIFAGSALDAYEYVSADFKAACPFDDFVGITALVRVFLGEIDEADVEVTLGEISYADGKAYVEVDGTLKGESLDGDSGDSSFSDFWVYEDGAWKWGTDDEEPCESDLATDDDDEEPVTGPGMTRDEALAPGEAAVLDDLRVVVLEADTDAGDRLGALSEFDATPVGGKRVVLARVRAEHTGEGDETIDVYESSFKLTGSNNVVYDSFGEETSCGFLSDPIEGELFGGGSAEGYVCFQAPQDETGFILIVEPPFTLDDDGRRFLRLE